MFRSSCNLLVLSILPGLSSMSCRYFQISTSVLWLIIIVPRVAPIAQTLWGHSTAPAKLNISEMELNVKVCFLYLCFLFLICVEKTWWTLSNIIDRGRRREDLDILLTFKNRRPSVATRLPRWQIGVNQHLSGKDCNCFWCKGA